MAYIVWRDKDRTPFKRKGLPFFLAFYRKEGGLTFDFSLSFAVLVAQNDMVDTVFFFEMSCHYVMDFFNSFHFDTEDLLLTA